MIAVGAPVGCVLVTGSTDGYHRLDAGAPECVDAQIAEPLEPDAALGDSGASLGVCVACITQACAAEVRLCQDECRCREATLGLFACAVEGRSPSDCAMAAVASNPSAAFLGLTACLQRGVCSAECGGGDGGT